MMTFRFEGNPMMTERQNELLKMIADSWATECYLTAIVEGYERAMRVPGSPVTDLSEHYVLRGDCRRNRLTAVALLKREME